MIALLAGGATLIAVLVLLRAFAGGDVRRISKAARYSCAGVLLCAAVGLAAMDRIGLAVLFASMAWGLFTGGSIWPWMPPNLQGDGRGQDRSSGRGPMPDDTGSAMSREEALKLLGLENGAGEAEVNSAHRRLILQTHPDLGGSSYLAAKINEARDVLLGR